MPELTPFLALALLTVLVGAVVQGSLGFGVGMIAAPVMMWTLPQSMPATLVMIGGVMSVLTLASSWRHIDGRGLLLALLGRLPGLAAGTWLLLVASPRALSIVVGLVVVGAAALQWVRWVVRFTPANLVLAGALSGAAGVVSGIGGPPLAMVYAGRPGPAVRGTLSAFFVIGTLLSLGGLAFAGRVSVENAQLALVFLPALVVGAVLARPVAKYLDSGRTRAAILLLAGASGAVLAVTAALG